MLKQLTHFIKTDASPRTHHHLQISLSCFLLFFLLGNSTFAQYVNVPVTGFNNDIVANGVGTGTALPNVSNPTVGIDGVGYHFITNNYQWTGASALPTCFMPATNTAASVMTAGLTYTLQNYSGNNALTIDSDAPSYPTSPFSKTGTLTLTTPASYSKLFVLYESVVNSNGYGTAYVDVTVTFTDLSTQVFSNNSFNNWFDNINTAFTSISRAQNVSPGTPATCPGGPYLFELPLTLSPSNYGKQVQSITITLPAVITGALTADRVHYFHALAVGGQAFCTSPSNQATAFTPGATTSSSIAASFTAATSAPTGYLVIRYPTGATPTSPVNGNSYTFGQALGLGTVVQSAATTSFTATGLTGSTSYDFYVYSYTNTATCGGPTYNTITPLQSTATTSGCGSMVGTYSVGPTGTYPSLTAALAALVSNGMGGAVILELQSTYLSTVETFPLNIGLYSCASASNTLTIRPELGATALSITNATAANTLNFNGANYVTIDGRPGGIGTTSQLAINCNNVGAFAAIQLLNDASFNTIKYTTLTSANNANTSGTVVFAGSTGFTGNDNNTVDNCSVLESSVGFPANAIYSLGTSATVDNNNNSVTNCNIANYFSATLSTAGILLGTGNHAWTITGNKLYQTASRTYTTGNTHYGISIASGSAYTVNNNTIGYANSAGTGQTILTGGTLTGTFPSAFTVTAGITNRYVGINAAFLAGGTVSSIQGNTIGGFALYSSSGATTGNGIWCGINVTSGSVNIGTTTGNTIGSATGQGAVYTVSTTNPHAQVGIYVTSANNVTIQNNTIGGLDAMGTGVTATAFIGQVTGIDVVGAGSFIISNNSIGNTTADNIRTGVLISGTNLSNTGAFSTTIQPSTLGNIIGVRSATTGNALTITGNTLRGWATSGTTSTITGVITSGAMTGANPSVVVDNNALGTATVGWVKYRVPTTANSGALIGISVTNTAAVTHSIQNNDITGINYEGNPTPVVCTHSHTYINATGGTTLANNYTISNNTFSNLSALTSTGTVTFIAHSYAPGNFSTQTISNNRITGSYFKNGTTTGGLTCMNSTAVGTGTGVVYTHTNNNFSNITIANTATTAGITGINNTDGSGASSTKTISGNTFNNWTIGAGTGTMTGMTYSYHGGAETYANNTLTNWNGLANITGMNIAQTSGTATLITASGNTINNLNSITTGGNVTGFQTATTSPLNVTGNTINNLVSAGASATTVGVAVTGATNTSVYGNTVHTLVGTGATAPIANGMSVSGGASVNIYKNKIYNISQTAAITNAGAVNGMLLSGGTTVNVSNNLIGDLRAGAANQADAIRGISVTSATASTSYNVHYNTVYLNATSTGAAFGTSGIYHAASATATTATLNLRNNIIINNSTPVGAAFAVAFRRSAGTAGTLANYANTSNNNFFYAPTTGGLIYSDGTSTAATMALYKVGVFTAGTINPRDLFSFSETFVPTSFFQSTTGSSASFLHLAAGIMTQCESGAINVVGFTDDFDSDIRQGNIGYTGTGTAPDVGADEFVGINPAPAISAVTYTPNSCTAIAHTISATITTNTGSITSADLVFAFNGVAQSSIAMTNTSGTTWTGTIPVATPSNAIVTWGILAQSSTGFTTSYAGTSYMDNPLGNYTAAVTASNTLMCGAASPTTLSVNIPQNTAVTVGVGATTSATYSNPFYSAWSNTHNQHLVLASELTAAGLNAGYITSLGLNITAAGTLPMIDLSIKMANTSATSMASYVSPAFTTVYTSASYLPSPGLNTLTFSAPFVWDGVSNVVIEICHGNSASTATMARTCTFDNTSYVSTIHTNKTAGTTGTNQCTDNTSGLLTYTGRPQFIFTGAAIPTTVSWSDGVSTVGSGTPLTLTPSTTTTYTAAITALGCSVTPSPSITINVSPIPAAPIATNSTQCATLIVPTASVASAAGASGTGQYFWYSAPVSGTLLQAPPYGPMQTYYSNNFSTATYPNTTLTGVAAVSSGALVLYPNLTNQQGGITVGASGFNSNQFQIDFDVTTTGTAGNMADGFSYSFGDDVSATSSSPAQEKGSGTKLKIGFDTYGAFPDAQGIYLFYNNTATSIPNATPTATYLGYSSSMAWLGLASQHVTITISPAGLLNLSIAGTPIFTNVQLPAAYINADKSTWKHVIAGRTGGLSLQTSIDNLQIQCPLAYLPGSSTYNTAISATTTFYVSELGTGGCYSALTPVTATLTTPPVLALDKSTAIVCAGALTTVNVTPATAINFTSYSWTGGTPSGTPLGVSASFAPNLTTTYTVFASDGVCSANASIVVNANPLPSPITASASASPICLGDTVNLYAGTVTGGLTTLLSENFNSTTAGTITSGNLPTGWTGSTVTPSPRVWGVVENAQSGATIGGGNMLYCESSLFTTNQTKARVESPVFDASGFNSLNVKFKQYYKDIASGAATDSARVFISNDGGATYTQLTAYDASQGTAFTSAGAVSASLAVGIALTNNMKVRWAYNSDAGGDDWYWALDDIIIDGVPKISYAWKSAPVGFTSAVQNPISVMPTGNTTYKVIVTTGYGCKDSNTVAVAVGTTPTPAPTATNSTQCALSVLPLASVASNAGALGTGQFFWYTAATNGLLIQTPPNPLTQTAPYGPLQVYYANDFSSAPPYPLTTLSGTAATSGNALVLHPNLASQQGGITIDASGNNSDKYQIDFDVTTTGTAGNMADGFSYSFGDDVSATATTPAQEKGSGTKLKIGFDTYGAGANPAGIYLFYNNTAATVTPPTLSASFLGYSNNVSWVNQPNQHVNITINAAGQLSLSVANQIIFSNVQLPAAFLSANKSTWKHVIAGRTGGLSLQTSIDNLKIQASIPYTPGYTTYQTPITTTTTFYVSELGVNGCYSPRTMLTATVNPPPALALDQSALTICAGSPTIVNVTPATVGNYTTYSWTGGVPSGTPSGASITLSPTSNTTYTLYASNATCNATASVSISTNPTPAPVTAATSATPVCAGSSVNLNATSVGPLPNILAQDFEAGLGTWAMVNSSTGANAALQAWAQRSNGYAYSTDVFTGNQATKFFMANSDAGGSGSTANTTITSPVFTTQGYTALTLTFKHYYRHLTGASAFVEVSTNGTTWTAVQSYAVTTGTAAAFASASVNLNTYIGNSTVYLRFRYQTAGWYYYWAVDDIAITGTPIANTYAWSATPAGFTSAVQNPTGVVTNTNTVYKVIATNSYGCKDSNTVAVATTPRPTSVVSGGGTGCPGTQSVSIALTGTAPWNLTYSNGTTFTNITTSVSPYVISAAGAGTYTVNSLSDIDCSAITADMTGSATVIINPRPTSIVSGGGTVCASATLPDVSIALTGTAPWNITYTDGTTPVTISTSINPYIIPTAPVGTYTVTALSDANCTAISTDMTGTATVIISNPQSILSGTATICNGASTNLSVAITNGLSPYTVVYSDGTSNFTLNNYVSGTNIPVSPSITTTYSLVSVTDANSCSGTSNTGTPTITVGNPSTAAVLAGTAPICNGSSTNLTITITGGTSPYTVVYSDGTSNTTINNYVSGTNILVSPTTTTMYSLISVTDATNCPGTGNSGTALVTVNHGATASVLSGNNTICGGSTDLQVAITGGTSPYTVVYSDGTSNFTVTNYTSATNISVSPNNTTTYSLVSVTDANGCLGTGNSGTALVTVNHGSTSAVLAGTTTICTGSSTNLTVTITGGVSPFTVVYFDGTANQTLTNYLSGSNISVSPTSTTTYTLISVSDANSCAGIGNTGSAIITVNSAASANAGFDKSTCLMTGVALAATGTGTWSGGLGTFSSLTAPTATYTPNVSETGTTVTLTWTVAGTAPCPSATDNVDVVVGDYPSTIVPTNGTTWTADYEHTDALGWTHYYNKNATASDYCDDYLVMSLKKNGNTIGTVGDGTFTLEVKGNAGSVHVTNLPVAPFNYVTSADWHVMKRYWQVTPTTQPISDVNVKFYYNTDDYDAVSLALPIPLTAHTDLRFFKINNPTVGVYDPNPTTNHNGIPLATAYNDAGYWQYTNGAASTANWAYTLLPSGSHSAEYVVAKFSGGGGGGGSQNGALPVDLLSFNGFNSGKVNILNWQTANEWGFDHFDVMRSLDNNSYEQIGTVAHKGGNGAEYRFVDESPVADVVNYYRLNLIDINGTMRPSNVVEIMTKGIFQYMLYPNPANEKLNVMLNGFSSRAVISINNTLGQSIQKLDLRPDQGNLATFDIASLAKGVYICQINYDGEIYSLKFVKE